MVTPATSDPWDSAATQARARIGTVLRDKWHLDNLIGVGGMAAVYAATHRNGKRVAVKMLHAQLSMDGSIRGRFLREGYVANKVSHPGAVSVIDDDTDEFGSVYLVMDLLEGETLDGRAQRVGGKLDPAEVLSMADQLLDVLAAAHDHNIIHRDIKPENVFVTREGQVKVLDFGIARMKEMSMASTATKAGSTMGTPAYMPPEQARGRWDEVDARTDLWAVGATMYTLLTGKLVHEAHTVNEQLLAAMTTCAPSVSAAVQGLPQQVTELIDKSLAFDRSDRWKDARTMQHALRVAYQALIGGPISTAPKLTVPEIALANIPASSPGMSAGRAATTGDAMISGQTGMDRSQSTRASRLAGVVAVAAASIVALVGIFITVKMAVGRAQVPASSSSAAVAAEVAPPATALAAAPSDASAVPSDQAAQVGSSIPTAKPEAGSGKKATYPGAATPAPIATPPKPVEPDMDKRR